MRESHEETNNETNDMRWIVPNWERVITKAMR